MKEATESEERVHVSRTDHDGGWTVAVDLLPVADEHVSVEVFDATALVAIDAPMQQTELDIALPEEGGVSSLRNGVLVVESDA